MKELIPNIELLRKTANRLRENWLGYEQSTFGEENDDAPCGTVTCLAGEIVICSSPTDKQGLKKLWNMIHRGSDIAEKAAKLAGIEEYGHSRNGDTIFAGRPYGWPARFRNRWEKAHSAGDGRRKAYAAADFLDYMADKAETKQKARLTQR